MDQINRIKLTQYLIDKHQYSTYLEIGTETGESFFPIKCSTKIAVDPCFKINAREKFKWYLKNPYNINAQYFELTSDQFFANQKEKITQKGLDIVLIDGLHTFLATLKDVLNSLEFLNKNGTIILHDCFPPHKAAGLVAANEEDAIQKGKNLTDWTGEWCGDSWKAIAYLRKKYKGKLKAIVLNADYGLGVVRFDKHLSLDLNIDLNIFKEIDKLHYEDLIKNPEEIVGLRNEEEYNSL